MVLAVVVQEGADDPEGVQGGGGHWSATRRASGGVADLATWGQRSSGAGSGAAGRRRPRRCGVVVRGATGDDDGVLAAGARRPSGGEHPPGRDGDEGDEDEGAS